MSFVIGLTGGIASGKSNAAKILGQLGAKVLDADIIGHNCYLPNTTCFYKVFHLLLRLWI